MTSLWNARSILITGAAGWLGYRLVHTLVHGLPDVTPLDVADEGPAIRCLLLPEQDEAPLRALSPRVEIVRGDVRIKSDCETLCAGAEGALLFHTAGIIHPRTVSEFEAINHIGTENLLRSAVAAGVRRAVVVSSNSPLGTGKTPDAVFDESSPYRPYMGYGRSKMRMEQATARIQAEGRLQTVLVRPPWFYGPYQPPRQTLFFEMIRDGKAPVTGSGSNLRSMVYIDNLCQGLMLAARHEGANGQTYWIADKRPYSTNEILDTVERLMETEFGFRVAHRRLRLPSLASDVARIIDRSLQSVGLYHQKFHVLSEWNQTIACSIAKAERELGYHPGVSLEEGMRRSLSYCVDRGLLRP